MAPLCGRDLAVPSEPIEWITMDALCGLPAIAQRELRNVLPDPAQASACPLEADMGQAPRGAAGGLSRRQRDCLLWLAQGAQTKQISDRLGLSDATVTEYIEGAKRRLGARTRPEAVAKAILRGYITL